MVSRLPPPDPTYTEFDENTEPPDGLIRSVMERRRCTWNDARRLMGLHVRTKDLRELRTLSPGDLFYYNCTVFRFKKLVTRFPAEQVRAERLCDRAGSLAADADAWIGASREVDLNFPDDVKPHLPLS